MEFGHESFTSELKIKLHKSERRALWNHLFLKLTCKLKGGEDRSFVFVDLPKRMGVENILEASTILVWSVAAAAGEACSLEILGETVAVLSAHFCREKKKKRKNTHRKKTNCKKSMVCYAPATGAVLCCFFF